MDKALSNADKRRTIGVATPHSHFFAELEAVRIYFPDHYLSAIFRNSLLHDEHRSP